MPLASLWKTPCVVKVTVIGSSSLLAHILRSPHWSYLHIFPSAEVNRYFITLFLKDAFFWLIFRHPENMVCWWLRLLLAPLLWFPASPCPWRAGSRSQAPWSPDVGCSLGNVDAIGRTATSLTFVPESPFLSFISSSPRTFYDPSGACENLSKQS